MLAQKLIDIHSQHQTLELTNDEFQFNIIDALADNGKDLELYKNTLKTYKTESITLHQLKEEPSFDYIPEFSPADVEGFRTLYIPGRCAYLRCQY